MVGQEARMKTMAGVSLAEQVLRDMGPLEGMLLKLYRSGGSLDDDTLASVMRILARLEAIAERRVDDNTKEHYRRQREEAKRISQGLPLTEAERA
jgi:hypothetical protein